ncbi:MAG: HAD family hydrolase [Acidobacteria bacterium]|nr:MAG: HAD family hydrolase [Acidobacteriota bacterium]MCE7957875.1 HAD family hydrolase [Acidobacteria bacterium ACB2]
MGVLEVLGARPPRRPLQEARGPAGGSLRRRGEAVSGPLPRLVLFDVDGTLLSAGPASRRVFEEALVEVFGTAGDIGAYRFEGKLDPVIVNDLMSAAGVPAATVAALGSEALRRYLDKLETALSDRAPALKPGVRELVGAVATSPGAVSALLTGNVARGARIKLSAAGLWERFAFGAFGDDAPTRVALGPVALARGRALTGHPFRGENCVVVGDAVADVECGRALGAKVVAVATGLTAAEALERAGADVVLLDFSRTDLALEAILG